MCSLFRSALALACCSAGLIAAPRTLRVCADPNNLPFSNERQEGFENRLAEIVAGALGAKVEYTWWPQRRGFVRKSLNAGLCDVEMGTPSTLDTVTVTRPYYRSTYVIVSRPPAIDSLDDPRLESMRVGVHLVGDDYAPPAIALQRRGLGANLVGFSLFGEEGVEHPPSRLIDAVARGDVGAAIVWGPFAGYFAPRAKTPLEVRPVAPPMFLGVPFTYEISMAVRKGDDILKRELDVAVTRECRAIRKLLKDYGVPLVEAAPGGDTCESSPGSSSLRSR